MADPLRHNCKLDIAEDILNFIAHNPDAEEVRVVIRSFLELSDTDLENAHEVVYDIGELIQGQQF